MQHTPCCRSTPLAWTFLLLADQTTVDAYPEDSPQLHPPMPAAPEPTAEATQARCSRRVVMATATCRRRRLGGKPTRRRGSNPSAAAHSGHSRCAALRGSTAPPRLRTCSAVDCGADTRRREGHQGDPPAPTSALSPSCRGRWDREGHQGDRGAPTSALSLNCRGRWDREGHQDVGR